MIKAVIKPTANPPTMEIANEVPAWVSEKVPVVHAMRATRKAISPEASFNRPSPFKIFEIRFGKVKRSEREAKATRSVGPSAAPTARQAANGKLAQRTWASHPILKVETKITGKIKKRTILQCFRMEVTSAS